MFDHDTIGIAATLLTMGDYTYARDYLATLPAQLQYDDAKWKYSWPYALYLQKTGDRDFVRSRFDTIKANTHTIETDRIDGGTGIIKQTNAIDSYGYWSIDNWSALAGLTTYRYLAEALGETAEARWAKTEYDDLLRVATARIEKTMRQYDLDYIPISMVGPNETGPRRDPRDANWASMFLFGRWAWDGYLFGADQSGILIEGIDQTYTHGFDRRQEGSDTIYNFGGYPHGFFSSAYNAGYGSTALRGEQFRDAGIKAYQFMIDKAMSGPFGWWEGVAYPSASSPWDIDHASGGGGSNQHMWGQSTATKVLFDSLIAEKSDGTVIVGRGIPTEWVADGQKVALDNYPVAAGARVGYSMTADGRNVTIQFTEDSSAVASYSVELTALKGNIAKVSVDGATIDEAAGTVRVPSGTTSVTIRMRHGFTRTTTLPSAAELSSNNGWDTGLDDGDYRITMNLWWGSNANLFKLYENGRLVTQKYLAMATPNAQTAYVDVTGRPNGAYEYVGVLVNPYGQTSTEPLTVKVTDAAPGTPALTADNKDGDGNYTVTANLWWGTNASSYRFLENGSPVASGELTVATPARQQASLAVKDKAPGSYVYTVEFTNYAGTTTSAPLTVEVG